MDGLILHHELSADVSHPRLKERLINVGVVDGLSQVIQESEFFYYLLSPTPPSRDIRTKVSSKEVVSMWMVRHQLYRLGRDMSCVVREGFETSLEPLAVEL